METDKPIRLYEHVSMEGLDIITRGLQAEQREIARMSSAILQERTIRYAERLRKDGYEEVYTP